jgi:hypothetical protein
MDDMTGKVPQRRRFALHSKDDARKWRRMEPLYDLAEHP